MDDVQIQFPAPVIEATSPTVALGGTWKVGAYRVEPMTNRVVGNGREVQLEPRVMDVLVCLMRRAGQTTTHDDLHDNVWAGVVVDESALRRAISQLRKAFDDDAAAPAYIETIRKTGYRLIAPVSSFSGGDEVGVDVVPHKPRLHHPSSARYAAAALLIILGAAAAMVAVREESDPSPVPVATRPLTSAPGAELRPKLSPDGSYVAYAADNGEPGMDLYVQVIDADTPLQLTATAEAETAPAWSPDGRRIAFMRMGGEGACEIFTISVLGGNEQKITDCGGSVYAALAWSPDGRSLAYPLREGASSPFRIVLLDLETMKRRTLTAPPSDVAGDIQPVFARDGKTVSFVRIVRDRHQDIYVIPADGGEARRLTNDGSFVAGHDWAPDGRSVVMSSNRSGRFKLWRVAADLSDGPIWLANIAAYDPGSPSFSSDGARLVYEEWSFDFNIWQQQLENGRPSGAPQRIVGSTRWDLHPEYSPDGRRIAFTSNRTGSHELWMAMADGGDARKLTSFSDGYAGAPRWSPDGREIVFEQRSGDMPGIYVVDAQGGRPRMVAEGGVAPSWSRDGRSIYFGSNRDGAWMVWKVPAKGGIPEVVAEGAYAAQEGFDGASLFYTKYAATGLWRRPVDGGSETLVLETLDPVDAESWVVSERGIYFVDRSEDVDQIRFHDSRSGSSHVVLRTAQPIPPGKASLAVSSDEKLLLYGQIDERESDIVLVEGVE